MAMIGLSKPYIAVYANNGSTVTYSGLTTLGRYTNLDISLNDSGSNDFYADNGIAESDSGIFGGGTVTITTDDLTPASLVTALGLTQENIAATTATTSPKWQVYGDSQSIPFIGLAGIVKKRVNGATKYVAVVLNKVKLSNPGLSVATQGESIEWQTQQISGSIYRSDATDHRWQQVSTPLDSEEDAVAAINSLLG